VTGSKLSETRMKHYPESRQKLVWKGGVVFGMGLVYMWLQEISFTIAYVWEGMTCHEDDFVRDSTEYLK